jgi:hypothetical protein
MQYGQSDYDEGLQMSYLILRVTSVIPTSHTVGHPVRRTDAVMKPKTRGKYTIKINTFLLSMKPLAHTDCYGFEEYCLLGYSTV